jgi:hypothetical protein
MMGILRGTAELRKFRGNGDLIAALISAEVTREPVVPFCDRPPRVLSGWKLAASQKSYEDAL